MAKVSQMRRKQIASGLRASIEVLLSSVSAIDELLTQPIPIDESFDLAEIVEFVNGKLGIYWATQRTLDDRYSDGKRIPATATMPEIPDIPESKLADYIKERTELRSKEIEIPGKRISIQSLKKAETNGKHVILISGQNMFQLKKWLITS